MHRERSDITTAGGIISAVRLRENIVRNMRGFYFCKFKRTRIRVQRIIIHLQIHLGFTETDIPDTDRAFVRPPRLVYHVVVDRNIFKPRISSPIGAADEDARARSIVNQIIMNKNICCQSIYLRHASNGICIIEFYAVNTLTGSSDIMNVVPPDMNV